MVANKKTIDPYEVDQSLQETSSGITQQPSNGVSTLPESYFKDNLNVGLEDLTQEDMPTPTLQLVQRTSKLADEEGRPYMPGQFYYKATRQIYDSVDVSILVFTKAELPTYNDKEVLENVYIFLGALSDSLTPFKMYLRGSGAGAARQFLGEVKALRRPMYALRVTLGSIKRENEFGPYYVPQFQIKGVETNPEKVVMLEDLAKAYSSDKGKIQEETAEEAKTYSKDSNMPF